jgi:hypothetical protein
MAKFVHIIPGNGGVPVSVGEGERHVARDWNSAQHDPAGSHQRRYDGRYPRTNHTQHVCTHHLSLSLEQNRSSKERPTYRGCCPSIPSFSLVYPHAAMGEHPIHENSLSAIMTSRVYPLTKTPLPSIRVSVLCWMVMNSAPSMKMAPSVLRHGSQRYQIPVREGNTRLAMLSDHTH